MYSRGFTSKVHGDGNNVDQRGWKKKRRETKCSDRGPTKLVQHKFLLELPTRQIHQVCVVDGQQRRCTCWAAERQVWRTDSNVANTWLIIRGNIFKGFCHAQPVRLSFGLAASQKKKKKRKTKKKKNPQQIFFRRFFFSALVTCSKPTAIEKAILLCHSVMYKERLKYRKGTAERANTLRQSSAVGREERTA